MPGLLRAAGVYGVSAGVPAGAPTVVAAFHASALAAATQVDVTISGQSGELLLALTHSHNNRNFNLPTDWTWLTAEISHTTNTSFGGRWAYRELSGALASETFTYSGGTGDDNMVIGVRITGHNPGSPFDPTDPENSENTEVSTSPSSPDLTTTVANCRIIRAFMWDNGGQVTTDTGYPSGTTGLLVRTNVGASGWTGIAHEEQLVAGAVGVADWGPFPSTNRNNMAFTVAVRAP